MYRRWGCVFIWYFMGRCLVLIACGRRISLIFLFWDLVIIFRGFIFINVEWLEDDSIVFEDVIEGVAWGFRLGDDSYIRSDG